MMILGLDSAVATAEENTGENMPISANLVIEMAQRIKDLEGAILAMNNKGWIDKQKVRECYELVNTKK